MARIIGTPENDPLLPGDDPLLGTASNDFISGLGGNDILIGLAGNDTLVGGPGRDTMEGGLGNDRYVVDADDRAVDEFAIKENPDEGFDVVASHVDWRLGDNFERLVLIGSAIKGIGNAGDNQLIGNAEDNTLQGLAGTDTFKGGGGNDRLEGGGGDDWLDGGIGDDILLGGPGNDLYFVDSLGDTIVEPFNRGTDLVFASVNGYRLSAYVENLFLGSGVIEGTGNDGNNYIQGNPLDNNLTGGDGNDTLDGRAGNDMLIGGDGNDTYLIESQGDRIMELPDGGIDKVLSSVTTYTLQDANVEILELLEGTGPNSLTGNDENNTLIGNTEDNTLNGGDGSDILNGGDGSDILNGGDDSDTLNGGNGDDFLVGDLGSAGGIDIMRGGEGADTFVLGQGGTNFYNDGNPSVFGNTEYARIEDFNFVEGDRIQLTNDLGDYFFQQSGNVTLIRLADAPLASSELLALVVNANADDVENAAFI
mgnify:CR=1 FL=1